MLVAVNANRGSLYLSPLTATGTIGAFCAVEADAGRASDTDLADKMANILDKNQRWRKTYDPVKRGFGTAGGQGARARAEPQGQSVRPGTETEIL